MSRKLTKANARKRLNEASAKLFAVQAAALEGKLGAVNMADMKKLFPMIIEIRKIADRLR